MTFDQFAVLLALLPSAVLLALFIFFLIYGRHDHRDGLG